MRVSTGLRWLLLGVLTVVACSSRSDEAVSRTSQALSTTGRVLSFEQPTTDWIATDLTVQQGNQFVDGAHSAAVTVVKSGGMLTSIPLTSLGPISSTVTLQVRLPSYVASPTWQGQIALRLNSPTAGVWSQYYGPVPFQNSPVGAFHQIQFTLPPAVVSALSTSSYSDLTVSVELDFNPNPNSGAGDSDPFYIDKLDFGQSVPVDGGAGGTSSGGGGASGSGGAGTGGAGSSGAGAGGTAGTAGASAGNSGGGAAGASGAGGSAGVAGETSGPCPFTPRSFSSATDIPFSIKLPRGVRREDIAIGTTGGYLTLDDGVRVIKDAGGFASVSNVAATNRASLGVSAEVQDIYSELTGIDLRSNAHVHGIAETAADVALQAGAAVDGATSSNASLEPLESVTWTASFPTVNRGSCSLEPDNTEIIDPGSYGDVAIKSRSHLKIRSGTYFFNSLSFEPQTFLDIANTAGPVFIYVRTTFAFSGTVAESDPAHMNFLFGVAGNGNVNIQSAFRGILVAPSAGVSLPTDSNFGHVGAFFANALIAHQNTNIHLRPFAPSEFCAKDAACSSFCPCDEGAQLPGSCDTAECCPSGSTAVVLTNVDDVFSNSEPNRCIVALDGRDTVQSFATGGTTVLAGPDDDTITVGDGNSLVRGGSGRDTIFASGGNDTIYGNDGDDTIFAANGDNFVVPGAGADNVSLGTGNDTVAIYDLCEVASGENLDGGDGDDTLITPVPLAQLTALGVSVKNFEHIVVQQNSCKSECVTKPQCNGHGTCAEGSTAGSVKCQCDAQSNPPSCTPKATGCNGSCGVGSVGCQADSDCPAATLCSGRTPGSNTLNVCQLPRCLTDPVGTGCGFPGAPCGPSCATKPTCATNSDCASPYVCGNRNGPRYGAPPGSNVCELPACQTAPEQTGCGNFASECGTCTCTPSCAGKTCGDSADGCGFTCPGVCVDREAGCTTDADCTSGSVCLARAGARVGLAASTNVCLPAVCRDSVISRIPCGDLNSLCGECPTPPANVCEGLACGTDPTFGVACGSDCANGTTCIGNKCVSIRFEAATTIDSHFGPPPGTPFVLPRLPIFTTDTVGAVPGSFEVTDRGTAHYSIPITVPPGRAGLEPQLSLDYTNTKENGYLGVGWSVSGLSAISTCARTLAVDGEARAVQDDGFDPYCLDGQRLIPVPDSAAEFRTEIDSFARISMDIAERRDGDGTPLPPSGPIPRFPSGFSVFTKDGKILHFTPTVWQSLFGKRVTRTWGLTKVSDRNGNSIAINYQEVPEDSDDCQAFANTGPGCNIVESVPSSIEYGINSALGGVPDRELVFHYTNDRPDRLFGFGEHGLDIHRTRLLDTLQTFVDGSLVRSYTLHYDLSPTTQSERLTAVQECAVAFQTETCKAPTAFTYNEATPSTTSSVEVQNDLVDLSTPVVLDWNGDGADDLMLMNGRVLVSDKHSRFTVASDSPGDILAPDDRPSLINAGSIFDYEQDGDDDVFDFELRVDPVTQKFSPSVVNYRVYLSSTFAPVSTPPFTTVTLALPPGLNITQATAEGRSARLLDVDGDGMKDLVLCRPSLSVTNDILTFAYYPGLPQGGFADRNDLPLPPVNPVEGCDAPASTMDVDGDGQEELLFGAQALHIDASGTPTWSVLKREGTDIVVSTLGSLFADINGDGLKDFVEGGTVTDGSVVWVSLNAGGTFLAPTPYTLAGPGLGGTLMSNLRVADMNGDHCDDLVMVKSAEGAGASAEVVIWYGDHTGSIQPTPAEIPFQRAILVPTLATIGNFNGDGSNDVVSGDANGTMLLLTSFHTSSQDLLSTILDGNGQRIEVTYDVRAYNPQFVSSSPQELVPCSWPALCDHSVGMVVSQSVVSGATRTGNQFGNFQKLSIEQYQYVRSRHGVMGRSSLGFQSRSIVHSDGHGDFVKRTDITFDNSNYLHQPGEFPLFPTAGRVIAKEELTAAAQSELEDRAAALHSRVDYIWSVRDSRAGRPMVFLSRRDSQNADDFAALTDQPEVIVTGSTGSRLLRARETFDVDDFGNVTHADRREQWHQDTLSDDAYNSYNVADTTFDLSQDRIDAWLISMPLHRTETNSFFDDQKTRETDYGFDGRGNLTQVLEDQNDCSVGRFTNTVPDQFGNVTDIVTGKPAGCDDEGSRSIHFDFDDHKLFPEQVVNSLGQVTQVRYDSRTGDLLSAVDPNGLATQLGYDAFGRLLQQVTPSGTETRRYQAVVPPLDSQLDVRSVVRVITDSSTGAHSEQDLDTFGREVRRATLGLDGKTVQSERSYTLAGLLDRVTRPHLPADASQGELDYNYDARQRLTSVKAADGSVTRYGYASATNCRSDICPNVPNPAVQTTLAERVLREFNVRGVFSPRDNSLTLTYFDHRGQPLRVVDGAGKETDYHYGAGRTLRSSADPDGNVAALQYDSHFRPISLNDPDKGIEGYSYTAFDELKSLTTVESTPHSRVLHRDTLGRVTRITDSNDGDTRFCFDAACDQTPPATDSLATTNEVGRLVESVSPSNIRTRYEFEPAPLSGGSLAGTNRGFLKAIHRTVPKALTGAASDEEFTTQYSYNDKNLVSQVQYPASAGRDFAVGYSYDGAGNLQSIFNPAASSQDPRGVFWQLRDDFQGLAYANEQFGDGTETTSQYENLTGHLHHLQTAAVSPSQPPNPLLDLAFTYYADGLVATADRALPASGEHRTEQYIYDALGRITTRAAAISNPHTGLSESESSTYSDSGNITFRSGPGDYTYDPTNKHRVTHANGIDFTYFTDNGDVRTRSGTGVVGGQQEFEYTGFHLPKQVLIGNGSAQGEVSFEYDASEQRALKTSALGQRLYADAYERFSPSATGPRAFPGETREHIYKVFGPNGLIAQVVRGDSGGQVAGEATLYIHSDEQGSPALVRDDSGANHGAPRWTTSGASDGGATWESTDDPLARTVRTTYTGHEFDEELGLTNMQGRIYDQSVARFMQPDPVVQAPYNSQGLNRYSYALNSPLNLVDPSGFDYTEQTPDGGQKTTIDVTEVCGGAGCDRAGGGEHSHGQGSASGASENKGRSDGSASPTTNSANAGGGDPTGGDKAHEPAGGPSGQRDQAPAQAAQAQHGAGNGGDFTPGKPQAQSGLGAGPPTWQPGDIGPPPPPPAYDEPAVPNQAFAPKVPNSTLNDPSFKVPDTSETWKNLFEAVTIFVPGGGEEEAAAKALPKVVKAVNSKLVHAAERAVEHGVASSFEGASEALRALSSEITKSGLPPGTILDSAHADRVLVPFGEGGYAVYQVAKNATAKLRTVLIAR